MILDDLKQVNSALQPEITLKVYWHRSQFMNYYHNNAITGIQITNFTLIIELRFGSGYRSGIHKEPLFFEVPDPLKTNGSGYGGK